MNKSPTKCVNAVTLMAFFIARCSVANGGSDGEKFVLFDTPETTVELYRTGWIYYGELDTNGDFIPDTKCEYGHPSSRLYSRPLTMWGMKEKKSFEYRSGHLIPGLLLEDGRFLPDVNGEVVKFSDYIYSKSATPIWNLPGYFTTKSQKPVVVRDNFVVPCGTMGRGFFDCRQAYMPGPCKEVGSAWRQEVKYKQESNEIVNEPVAIYKFVVDTNRWVGIERGVKFLVGKLDSDGELMMEHKINKAMPGMVPSFTLLNRGPKRVYELRSSR